MVNGLIGGFERGRGGERFAAPEIAGITWMRAAGNLEPDAMPARKTIGGGPQLNADPAAAVGFGGRIARLQT